MTRVVPWLWSWVLVALMASGCLSGDGPGASPSSSSSAASSSSPPSTSDATSTPPRPAPDWDFTLPPLPNETVGPANSWHRGADLDPAWNATAAAGPGLYQLVWWIEDTRRDPSPGYACGASMGTQTDFDAVHHAARTGWEPFLADGAVAFVSHSYREASTSCGGKQHMSVMPGGEAVPRRTSQPPTLPFEVLANGTLRIDGTGLWLAAGQTAEFRTDRWENRTAGSGAASGLQQPQPASVHVTGLARIVHLGAWEAERVWVEDGVCADGPDRSRNCIDRGHGP